MKGRRRAEVIKKDKNKENGKDTEKEEHKDVIKGINLRAKTRNAKQHAILKHKKTL